MTQDILAYLTNPYPTGSDDKIHQIYLELFRGIQSNSRVHAAFYMWQSKKQESSAASPEAISNALLSKVRTLPVDAQLLFDKDFITSNIHETLGDLAIEKCARWASGSPDSITYRPSSDKYYIFKGNEYIRHTHGKPVDSNYPKSLVDIWSGWPIDWLYGYVDAVAYYEPTDRYYLFKGKEYARHPHNFGLDSGYPKNIKAVWSGWPDSWGIGNVDAVVYYPPTKRWYLFKGDEYVRHRHGKGPDAGYPKMIADHWSGWPSSWGNGRVDGVVWHPENNSSWWEWGNNTSPDGKFYLLKGNEYVRHAFGSAPDAGYPKRISSVWSGWPAPFESRSPLAYDAIPDKAQGLSLDGKPKLHNKTLLFSELKFTDPPTFDGKTWPSTMKHVVVESSANIWRSQYHQSNQLILTYGHRELYEDALRRFKNILHRKRFVQKFPTYSPKDKNFTMHKPNDIKVYGFPRNSDLIESILDNISKFIGESEFEAEDVAYIRIAMADFTRLNIAKKLTTLKKRHCNQLEIRMVTRHNMNTNEKMLLVKDELQNGQAPDREKIDSLVIDPHAAGDAVKIHTKSFMYEGPYVIGGKMQWCKLVWCGAHNFTYSALKTNSETLWRIWNDGIYDAFVENFHSLESGILL